MADHSITVTNTLAFHGHGYPPIWNAVTWNSFTWGYSADAEVRVTKVVDTTVTPTTDAVKYVIHLIENEGTALDSDVVAYVYVTITNDLTFTIDMYSQVLTDSEGYSHVFPGNATNAEDRDTPTWTGGAAASTTWASSSAASTTWSAA